MVPTLALALAILPALASAFQVGYPNSKLVQCSMAQLQWSGSTGQTSVAVVDASGSTVKDFDRQPDNTFSVTWYPIDARAGKSLYVKVVDGSGQTAMSPKLSVNPSNDDSCLVVEDVPNSSNPLLPTFTLFSGPPLPVMTTAVSSTAGPVTTTLTSTSPSPSETSTPPSPVSSATSTSSVPPSTMSTSAPDSTGTSASAAPSTPSTSPDGAISLHPTLFPLALALASLLFSLHLLPL